VNHEGFAVNGRMGIEAAAKSLRVSIAAFTAETFNEDIA